MADSAESTAAVKHAVSATVDVDTLERYLSKVHAVVDEAKFEFTENGITCDAVDPANVALINSHLDARAFENYDAVDIKIGLGLHKFKSILEYFEGDVTLTVNAADSTLAVTDGEAKYGINYIDPDKIRDGDEADCWETTSKVLVPGDKLKRAVSLATEAGDAISLQYASKTELLTVRNDDGLDTAALDIPVEDVIENEDGGDLYTEDYLNDILDAIEPSDTVNVTLGDEVPVSLHVANGAVESKFAIAPRITGVDD